MRDLRRYWQEVRALQMSLPEFLWIVDHLGTLVEVTAEIAAKLLHAKSHRVAAEEEVRAHLNQLGKAAGDVARLDKEASGVAVVPIPTP